MISVDVKLHGFDELRTLLRQLPDETKIKALKPSVRETGNIALGYAISESPYRTGVLRRNIRLVVKGAAAPWRAVTGLRVRAGRRKNWAKMSEEQREAAARNDPYYWFWHEFGWTDRAGRKHEGKAYLRNALERHVPEHINGFRNAFRGKLDAVVRRMHAKQRASARSGR